MEPALSAHFFTQELERRTSSDDAASPGFETLRGYPHPGVRAAHVGGLELQLRHGRARLCEDAIVVRLVAVQTVDAHLRRPTEVVLRLSAGASVRDGRRAARACAVAARSGESQ